MSRARDLADSADKDIAGTLTVDAITASGTIAANSYTGDGSSLTGINTDLVADTTPQLGGNLDTNGNDINFGDNDKAVFGAGSDLQIYHNGTQSIIEDVGTGPLRIRSNSISIENELGTETISALTQDGAVIIYYDGSPKLVTTSSGIDVTGNITVSGTVDGRDVATDGSKLDGIESGATADQTASEILTLIKTVDGSGSGLDADMLDGYSRDYYRQTVNSTKINSTYNLDNLSDDGWYSWTSSNPTNSPWGSYANLLQLYDGSQKIQLAFGSASIGRLAVRRADSGTFYDWANFWSEDNDGSGSGLDADLLDGVEGSNYLRSNTSDTFNGILTVNDSWDYQIELTSPDTWTGIKFNDSNSNSDVIWHNGNNGTFAIGGGGSNVSGKKLHIDGGTSIGSGFDGTAVPTNGLYVQGDIKTNGDITISGAGTLRDVTGEYGSIEVDGGATNNWEGYSIGGQVVFMTDGSAAGIYNDYNNQWMIRAELNGETALRHAGSEKLATTSSGISVTGNISLTDVLLLDQNASNHSSTTEGALYYNTADDAIRVYAGGRWNNLSMLPAVTPAALNFMNHNYTRSSYTGQDGYTRTYGKLTSPTQTYAGNTFATAFDGASNHVLVLRFLASSAAYIGLGVSIASSITDAQADNNPGSSYYGLGGDWTGASGVTHYGGYFNSSSTVPTHTTTDGYVYIYTEGSGASRTLQMKFSAVYSSDFLNTGTELQAGGDTPSGGTRITQSILPITIGTNDLALAIGEASDTYEWRIERYGTY
jgi:hypothetical protein